ncbi:MAG: beta strand repeat-containing protein [Flavobacteriales bacterium]
MEKIITIRRSRNLIGTCLIFLAFFAGGIGNVWGQTAVNCPTSGYTTVNAYSTNFILYDNGGPSANYSNNCNGYIFIRGGGSKVITISGSYATESGYDYIYIYEGEGLGSGTALASLTGTNSNYTFTGTAGKSYTIRFYSDFSNRTTGFAFNVTTTGTAGTLTTVPNGSNNSVTCGTNVMLQDPQGTGNYANNQSGFTVLNNPGCATISLLGSYWLEGSSYDLVRIYDGSGISGSVLATYGASAYGLINYTGQPGQTLTVQFTSDGSNVNPGFYITANYSGSCTPPPGNPNVFGSNAWNVYCYGAGDASGGSNAWASSQYRGFYTMSTLNFDTRTGQTNSNAQSWGDGGSPSSASGYQGCTIGVDNHSYIFRRQGFTCGTYQLNLPSHDDMAILLVDGIEVWRNYGCCATRTAVWTGYLGSTSTVELRVSEGVGGSHGALEFVSLPISATVTGTNPTTCGGNGSITMSNVQNGHRSVYQSDFSSTPAGASLSGNASVSGGELTLTTAANSQLGSTVFTPSYRANAWTANYSQFIGGGNGADGMSFTYGSISGAGNGEAGWASGLVVSFDTHNGATNSQLNIYWNGSIIWSSALNVQNFRSGNYVPVKVSVNTSNQLSVTWNSIDLLTNYGLPSGYISADKSAWNYGFSARTGGVNDAHRVSDLYISSIAFLEYSINGTSWSSTNPILAPAGSYTVQARPVGITCPNSNIGTVTLTNPNTIDWANLQFPASATICSTGSATVYGRVYKAGFTNVAGADANMTVQVGISSSNTNPNTWAAGAWSNATYNVQSGNDDEYQATFSGLAAGTYYYAFRYRYCSDGAWYYGGYNASGGGFWNGSANVSGVLTVNQPSTAPTSITGNTTLCNGSSTTLTAAGGSLGTGANYEWGTGSTVGTNPIAGQTGASISVSPASTTTYWVRIINSAAPCATTTSGVSATVTVNQPSSAPTSITGTTAICNGSSITLTAVGGILGTNSVYEWGTGTTVGSNVIAGQTAVSISVSPTSTTSYWVRIVNGTAPCSATTAGISTAVSVNQPSVNPTSITGNTVCLGSSTTLTAVGGTLGQGANYQWGTGSVVGSNPVSGATSSTLSVSPTSSTNYWVQIVNGTGPCSATTAGLSTLVTINTPTFTASPTAGSVVWRGATSTNWATASNWYAYDGTNYTVASSTPTASSNVIIPANQGCVAQQPAVALSGTVNANNVTIETGIKNT